MDTQPAHESPTTLVAPSRALIVDCRTGHLSENQVIALRQRYASITFVADPDTLTPDELQILEADLQLAAPDEISSTFRRVCDERLYECGSLSTHGQLDLLGHYALTKHCVDSHNQFSHFSQLLPEFVYGKPEVIALALSAIEILTRSQSADRIQAALDGVQPGSRILDELQALGFCAVKDARLVWRIYPTHPTLVSAVVQSIALILGIHVRRKTVNSVYNQILQMPRIMARLVSRLNSRLRSQYGEGPVPMEQIADVATREFVSYHSLARIIQFMRSATE